MEANRRQGDCRYLRIPIHFSMAICVSSVAGWNPSASIEKVVMADNNQLADSWFKDDFLASLGDVNIERVHPSNNDDQSGIVAAHLSTPGGLVVLD